MKALLDRYVSVSDDRTAQIVAGTAAEAALAGIGIEKAFYNKILRVNVTCIRRNAGHRQGGVFIGAKEIAQVAQQGEIRVAYRGLELFYTLGILRVEAMVF